MTIPDPSVISRMWFTDWLGQDHVLSCDAGKVGPVPFEPHHLGVRKEGTPKETWKEELGAGEAETAGGHFVVDDERESALVLNQLYWNIACIQSSSPSFSVQWNESWQKLFSCVTCSYDADQGGFVSFEPEAPAQLCILSSKWLKPPWLSFPCLENGDDLRDVTGLFWDLSEP